MCCEVGERGDDLIAPTGSHSAERVAGPLVVEVETRVVEEQARSTALRDESPGQRPFSVEGVDEALFGLNLEHLARNVTPCGTTVGELLSVIWSLWLSCGDVP